MAENNFDAALGRAQDYVAKDPEFFWSYVITAAVLGRMDRIEEATAALDKVLALEPTFADDTRGKIAVWYYEPDPVEQLIAGLRKAGLDIPDEPAAAD